MTTSLIFFCFLLSVSVTATGVVKDGNGTQLILVNNCKESVWPGILSNEGHPSIKDGGFHLPSGEELVLQLPNHWAGRIWGRQGCFFHETTGKGTCQTGDCGGQLKCKGIGGVPPATLVEMTLGTSHSPLHYYDVSLVDGFNLPMSMKPIGGGVGCGIATCQADLNGCCPSQLVVKHNGKVVGCKSACLATKSDKYCCTGEFADPKICKPTMFARVFKSVCPHAYSYAYDDATGLMSCLANRYAITFCPP
ncbi:thaumatin-like protein [Medicago truncatula]|uniref:Pathogenesis-related thaumatin family protein n=1 Tax=Medicago truncatula TaxID=3880 RepID=A0A072UY44_MEDTR|nr:thaumatin-like protein [Medicago truncatula]KEH34729.1 pathogenesis-related thaumatin family protein [Medicago truncatula]